MKILSDKQVRILSIAATLMAVGMYVAYIPQIQMNLSGQKGVWLQPLVAAINCTLWVIYALFKKTRYSRGAGQRARHFSRPDHVYHQLLTRRPPFFNLITQKAV